MITDFVGATITRVYTFAAASIGDSCDAGQSGKLFGVIPKWYAYLPSKIDSVGKCSIALDDLQSKPTQLLLVGLAVVDALTAIAGVVAFVYLLYGGFLYVTSQGEPDNAKKALETIRNAIIGMAIAVLATSVVSFLGNRLG